MLANVWVQRVISVLVAAGLYVLASHYVNVSVELKVLAGFVVGWLSVPRLGDSRSAGVHPDDADGGRW